ncbi:hypothetical protein FACS1894142_3360 [Spirochaetia bacterium]|nr:hypothetical protein FACS1894142_3360 [Spirochaetia bacterium]
MKKKMVLTGIIVQAALAAMLVFGIISCKDPTGTTTYTVTYTVGRGSGDVPAKQTVDEGTAITLPNQGSMTAPSDETFDGWKDGGSTAYAAGASYTVNANVTFTAQWKTSGPVRVPATTLAGALLWLGANVADQTEYIIELTGNESIDPQTLYFPGKAVTITLRGGSTERTVDLYSVGSLFTVRSGVTLVLDSNITLRGISGITDNTTSLVSVSGGTLVMNDGSKITGNSNRSSSTSSPSYGGGVYVSNGVFTMTGGTISYNEVYCPYSAYGGGVDVGNGTFTMSSGTISYNEASGQSSSGGGVDVDNGTFTMSGGTISNNRVHAIQSYGGGVSGTFTMTGGTISGNTASSASSFGGHSSHGGGVSGSLIKTGDSTITDTNSAANGAVAYVSSSQKRETAAGPDVNLDYRVPGSSGGWE